MNEITCSHGNGPECSKCEALDIPEVEELERELRARIAELEAERDAARAGEARAVEALKQGRVLAQKVVGETWDLAGSFTDKEQALFDWVEDLDWPRYPTPALDWLAQREREAAQAEREANTDTVRAMGPHFFDFFFGEPGEAEYLQQQLAAACGEAARGEE